MSRDEVDIDLVKLESQVMAEGSDEETETHTPSESVKETESPDRSGFCGTFCSHLDMCSCLTAGSIRAPPFRGRFAKWPRKGYCFSMFVWISLIQSDSFFSAVSLRYYDLLRVKPSASAAEVKKAYYKERMLVFFFKSDLAQQTFRQPNYGRGACCMD